MEYDEQPVIFKPIAVLEESLQIEIEPPIPHVIDIVIHINQDPGEKADQRAGEGLEHKIKGKPEAYRNKGVMFQSNGCLPYKRLFIPTKTRSFVSFRMTN
jgi:hypothetical protein